MVATPEAFSLPPQEPAADATHAENEHRYPLYLVERPAGFYWRLPNCGVTLFGTPLVLLFIVKAKDTMHVLGVLAAGAFFCWPLWKMWGKDRPRLYSPRDLPEDLVG